MGGGGGGGGGVGWGGGVLTVRHFMILINDKWCLADVWFV